MTDRNDLIAPTAALDLTAIRQAVGALVSLIRVPVSGPKSDHLKRDAGVERDAADACNEVRLYTARYMRL